jgi:hypothetical protein
MAGIQFHPPDTAPVWARQPIAPSQAQTADTIVALVANPSGGVIAVGQTTPAGQTDPNNVQTAIAVIKSDGTDHRNQAGQYLSGRPRTPRRGGSRTERHDLHWRGQVHAECGKCGSMAREVDAAIRTEERLDVRRVASFHRAARLSFSESSNKKDGPRPVLKHQTQP